MMERSHFHQHPKFCAKEASNCNDDSHSDDDYNVSDMSVSSSFSIDSNQKHILEEAYDEMIGTASLFQEEMNNNHLDDKHNIGSNANGHTVVGTPSQPPPTVSAALLRLIHRIAHDDLVQDEVMFFSINLEHGGKKSGILQYLWLVKSQELYWRTQSTCQAFEKHLYNRGVLKSP